LAPYDQWDNNMLDLLFSNELYDTGLEFTRTNGYPTKPDGCVLIVPGRYWFEKVNAISESLARFEWVLAIRTGDEENLLDPEKVYHPNIKWWVQTPKVGFDYPQGSRFFGVGYPKHLNHPKHQERDTDSFISAQRTHQRRVECFAAMNNVKGVKQVQATEGFTQGMDPDEYALWMAATKTAPAPSGPESPDSFRAYEALQAHAVPIVDDITPAYDSAGYWNLVHPNAPFPILTKWEQLPGYTQDVLKQWPANANRITAWWMRYKRQLSHWLVEDLDGLGAL
jgi:hypothetical protein